MVRIAVLLMLIRSLQHRNIDRKDQIEFAEITLPANLLRLTLSIGGETLTSWGEVHGLVGSTIKMPRE